MKLKICEFFMSFLAIKLLIHEFLWMAPWDETSRGGFALGFALGSALGSAAGLSDKRMGQIGHPNVYYVTKGEARFEVVILIIALVTA